MHTSWDFVAGELLAVPSGCCQSQAPGQASDPSPSPALLTSRKPSMVVKHDWGMVTARSQLWHLAGAGSVGHSAVEGMSMRSSGKGAMSRASLEPGIS